jgi:cytidine deaminase
MNKDFIVNNFEELSDEVKNLIEAAKSATVLAYAPYSSFFVGTSLLLENGALVTGANQENASYPLCMCAERVALYSKSMNYPQIKIVKMVVVACKDEAFVPATCCGACRQVMVEYEQRQAKDFEVIMQIKPQKWLKSRSAAVLVPFQFEF